MAAVAVVMPPPPAPVVRISRLALAAADDVVCLWIASLWVFHASLAVGIIGFLVCGLRLGCTGAPWTAVLVSLLFVVIVWPLAAMLLGKFVEPFYTNQLVKGAAALEPISEAFIEAHVLAISLFVCLEACGFLLKPLAPKDPPTEKLLFHHGYAALWHQRHVLPRFHSGFCSKGVEDETTQQRNCGTHLND